MTTSAQGLYQRLDVQAMITIASDNNAILKSPFTESKKNLTGTTRPFIVTFRHSRRPSPKLKATTILTRGEMSSSGSSEVPND
jgi:hypothetical protein